MLWSSVLACAIAVHGAVHESVQAPQGWRPAHRDLGEHEHIRLHVALQYENLDALEAKVHSVSDPDSSTYGHYLEPHELDELFAPSKDRKTRVASWLESHSVHILAREGNTITFETTIAEANHILNASFRWYTDGATITLGTLSYSVPDELSGDVDIITPTTYFGSPVRVTSQREQQPSTLSVSMEETSSIPGCHDVRKSYGKKIVFVNSTCYPTLYDIGDYIPDQKSGSNIAFASFAGIAANYADLQMFEQQFGIPQRNISISGLINGGKNHQHTSLIERNEANLDVQTIISLVGMLPVGEYIEHGLDLNRSIDPFLEFYQYLLAQPSEKLPWVISSSYAAFEDQVPLRYGVRTCNTIGMLGLRGRTILVPAGDSGPGFTCKSGEKKQFTPMFPSSCPYATAAGGTQNTAPVQAGTNGGGGFSNLFAAPAYQQNAISTYLKSYISPTAKKYYESHGYVNFSGRGIPDIAANFGPPSFPVVDVGKLLPGLGTSEATPIVASIVALLNDGRFKAGKPAMGFINPWLYKRAVGKGVVDVTKGGSVGCTQDPHIPYASWNATPGWDPVTGIGYPQFQKMLALALNATSG